MAGGGQDLRNTAQTEPRTPVCDLSDSNGVDTLVDSLDSLAAVDVHESGHGAGSFAAGLNGLVLGHFDGLHASAEAHGRVRLRETTGHAADDATAEVVGAEALCVELGFGSDEEEDGALGGGFDPGPGDETLVDCFQAMSAFMSVACSNRNSGSTYSLGDHHGPRSWQWSRPCRLFCWQPWWSS